MQEVTDDRLTEFEDLAWNGFKEIKRFFEDESDKRRPLEKAKVAASLIGAYARLRASETNRMSVELNAEKSQAVLLEVARAKAMRKGTHPKQTRPQPKRTAA